LPSRPAGVRSRICGRPVTSDEWALPNHFVSRHIPDAPASGTPRLIPAKFSSVSYNVEHPRSEEARGRSRNKRCGTNSTIANITKSERNNDRPKPVVCAAWYQPTRLRNRDYRRPRRDRSFRLRAKRLSISSGVRLPIATRSGALRGAAGCPP